MQLFYAPGFVPPVYTLDEEESRHCVRVLRLKEGDGLHLTDGRGNLYACRIVRADARGCRVEAAGVQRDFEPLPAALTLAVAPTKNAERFEWMLEKVTEVGVSRIIPVESEHSERRVFKAARGEKVITAAMKQSLKAWRPVLEPLTPFDEVLSAPFEGRRFIAHCAAARSAAGKEYLPAALRPGEPVQVLIGPEGDFSEAEIDRALACGFSEITLGSQRLRTETAGLAAAVMVSVVNGMQQHTSLE